jgi:hypothetical protein
VKVLAGGVAKGVQKWATINHAPIPRQQMNTVVKLLLHCSKHVWYAFRFAIGKRILKELVSTHMLTHHLSGA